MADDNQWRRTQRQNFEVLGMFLAGFRAFTFSEKNVYETNEYIAIKFLSRGQISKVDFSHEIRAVRSDSIVPTRGELCVCVGLYGLWEGNAN